MCRSFIASSTPTLPEDIQLRAVSVLGTNVCGLRHDNTLWCDEHATRNHAPLPTSAFSQLSVGTGYLCGLTLAGSVECWGMMTPPIYEGDIAFQQISMGSTHGCGLDSSGTIHCWGGGADAGKLTAAPTGEWVQIDAGSQHTCALNSAGTVHCWGLNSKDTTVPDDLRAD